MFVAQVQPCLMEDKKYFNTSQYSRTFFLEAACFSEIFSSEKEYDPKDW